MRAITLVLVLVAGLAPGCAGRRSAPAPVAGEVRGIYMQGMEGGLFRLCGDSTGFGRTVALQAGVEPPTPQPEGGRSTRHGWTYHVYYVRWVMSERARIPPRETVVRINSRPQLVVTRILEMRAPQAGECGWRAGELRDSAP